MLVVCSCGKRMDVADRLAGKWVRCPRCRAKMKVQPLGDADLPIALDRPPEPKGLQPEGPLWDAASPEGPLWDSAAGEPTEENPAELVLGDLAAAVSEANGKAARRASPASDVPLALSRPPSASRPRGKGVAVAQLADDEGPPEKKRDLLPFIITGAAAVIFLGVLIGIIIVKVGSSGPAAPDKPLSTVEARQPLAAPPRTDDDREWSSDGFFGHVKPRTSEDYRREKEEREKKQQTP